MLCPGTTPFVIYGNGSVVTPFILTSKCACGPVEYPVEPTFNIASPLFTVCPTSTNISEPCAYNVEIPPPWSIITIFPYAVFGPAFTTTPSFAATKFAPIGAPMSTPVCNLYCPVIG